MTGYFRTLLFSATLAGTACLAPSATARDAGERAAPARPVAGMQRVAALDGVTTDAIAAEAARIGHPGSNGCAPAVCVLPGS